MSADESVRPGSKGVAESQVHQQLKSYCSGSLFTSATTVFCPIKGLARAQSRVDWPLMTQTSGPLGPAVRLAVPTWGFTRNGLAAAPVLFDIVKCRTNDLEMKTFAGVCVKTGCQWTSGLLCRWGVRIRSTGSQMVAC